MSQDGVSLLEDTCHLESSVIEQLFIPVGTAMPTLISEHYLANP